MKILFTTSIFATLLAGSARADDIVGTIAWYTCSDGEKTYHANVRQNFWDWKPYYLELVPQDGRRKIPGYDLEPDEYTATNLGYDKKGSLLRKGTLEVKAKAGVLDLKLDCEYSDELNPKSEERIPSSRQGKKHKKK